MNKVRKSFLKRFKITGKGKFLRRIIGQSHCFSKKSSNILKRKKQLEEAPKEFLEYKHY